MYGDAVLTVDVNKDSFAYKDSSSATRKDNLAVINIPESETKSIKKAVSLGMSDKKK